MEQAWHMAWILVAKSTMKALDYDARVLPRERLQDLDDDRPHKFYLRMLKEKPGQQAI